MELEPISWKPIVRNHFLTFAWAFGQVDRTRQTFHIYQKMRKNIPHLLILIPWPPMDEKSYGRKTAQKCILRDLKLFGFKVKSNKWFTDSFPTFENRKKLTEKKLWRVRIPQFNLIIWENSRMVYRPAIKSDINPELCFTRSPRSNMSGDSNMYHVRLESSIWNWSEGQDNRMWLIPDYFLSVSFVVQVSPDLI